MSQLGTALWTLALLALHATATTPPPTKTATTPPPTKTPPSLPSLVHLADTGSLQAVLGPEPGMVPLPYFRSYFYPGPAPTSLSQPFNLSLPGPPMAWFQEPESGFYRTPQDRHVFGPFSVLPSALLLKGTISMGGSAQNKGTQGALYAHQQLYYDGGAEMGWVYFCSNLRIAAYMCTNANKKSQKWMSHYAPDQKYLNTSLSFRMGWDTAARFTTAQVYSAAGPLYDLSDPWPNWMGYNSSLPWYITVTWQRSEDGVILGALRNASLWYIPGAPGQTTASPPRPRPPTPPPRPAPPLPPPRPGPPMPPPRPGPPMPPPRPAPPMPPPRPGPPTSPPRPAPR